MANMNFKYVIHIKLIKKYTKKEFQNEMATKADCDLPLFATKLSYGFGFTNDITKAKVYNKLSDAQSFIRELMFTYRGNVNPDWEVEIIPCRMVMTPYFGAPQDLNLSLREKIHLYAAGRLPRPTEEEIAQIPIKYSGRVRAELDNLLQGTFLSTHDGVLDR